MYKRLSLIKKITLGVISNNNVFKQFARRLSSNCNASKAFKMEKVLVVSKLTRYEYEKLKRKHLSDDELEKELRNSGTEYDKIVHYHNLHKHFEQKLITSLKEMGLNVQVVNRLTYTLDNVKWADVVLPNGGDGTFLLAASKVLNNDKPVIGFNSDPQRSEGHLCLPAKCSDDIKGAIQQIKEGKFEWLFRSRIRTTIIQHKGDILCKPLHDIGYFESWKFNKYCYDHENVLPILALNEVFIGESCSARVSHMTIRLNDSQEATAVKCSGICVSTGTGSTSWHMSINRLPVQTVAELLRLVDVNPTEGKDSFATILANIYNNNLIFSADDKRMGYTIRDNIQSFVWPKPKGVKSRDFANRIELRSNCYDGCLVVDGGLSFCFNDGNIAIFEIHPEDSLRTIVLCDD